MAISAADMTKALNSPTYAERLLKNPNCALSEEQKTELTDKYGQNKVAEWQKAAKDDNRYEIEDDSETQKPKVNEEKKAQGKQKAADETDHDGSSDKAGSAAGAVTTGAVGVVAGAAGMATSLLLSVKAIAAKCAISAKTCCWVAAAAGTALLAMAGAIKAANPNKDEAEALDKLRDDILPEAQDKMEESQQTIEDDSKEIEDSLEQAQKNKEESEKTVGKEVALMKSDKAEVEKFNNKDEDKRTDADKSRAKSAMNKQAQRKSTIDTAIADTAETNGKVKEDVEACEQNIDTARDDASEAQGEVEFDEGFDEDTKKGASMLKTASTIGMIGSAGAAAGGAIALAQAFMPWTAWKAIPGSIALGTGVAAGILFKGIGSDQGDYKESASTEIEVREQTADMTNAALENTEVKTEEFEVSMEMAEEFANPVETPEDMKPVQMDGQGGAFGNMGVKDKDDKKEDKLKEKDEVKEQQAKEDKKNEQTAQKDDMPDFNSLFVDDKEKFER